MRRISLLLAATAVLLTIAVGYTYKVRIDTVRAHRVRPTPQVQPSQEAIAERGWSYGKDDPQTNRPVVRVTAKAFEAEHDPSAMGLRDVTIKLYDKAGDQYTYVRSDSASFDEGRDLMKSHGAVHLVMNVPVEKNAENPADAAKLLQVETSGVAYNTQTGSAQTDAAASFHYPAGSGSAIGVSYDPAKHELRLKSKVSLEWIGNSPEANAMHIEAGELLYRESEHKIYLSPWSKMVRLGTTIEGKDSVITVDANGELQRVDAHAATGVDVRDDKTTHYQADLMTASFDDQGGVRQIDAIGHAIVSSEEAASHTTLKGDRASMRFAVTHTVVNNAQTSNSALQTVQADGHALAESVPVPQPGVVPPETRILHSEHIELVMNADGKSIHEIRSPTKSQLEFQPNAASQLHRTVNASSLEAVYGDGSYIQKLEAENAITHTDRPHPAKGNTPATSSEAITSSDHLLATFEPSSNRLHMIRQNGHFRYQEGKRKASAENAVIEEQINRITLEGKASVADDTGSTSAEKIVMNQASGDMDAMQRVVSLRTPDANQKPGSSMLDPTRVMEAKADQMMSRQDNTDIFYVGHATMWQGGNRITADRIEINRDDSTVHASGNVVSQLIDNKPPADPNAAPVVTVVRAPELLYRDDLRLADYTGGVKLNRLQMVVTGKEVKAYLTPKSPDNPNDSSLDHAFADGDVRVVNTLPTTQRKGTSEHCEYYAKTGKVILNGGHPEVDDTRKGTTKGRQITYFSDDDRLIVEGEKKELAYTRMKK